LLSVSSLFSIACGRFSELSSSPVPPNHINTIRTVLLWTHDRRFLKSS
jgi:hypothetical protein